jgi:putative tryptophan/tyrosine transport system substrate-binding protein
MDTTRLLHAPYPIAPDSRTTCGRTLMIDRRTFLVGTGTVLLAAPLAADAQQAGRIPRIGVLWHAGSADEEGSYYTGLLEGFRDLGYVDGRNIILEHRFPNEMPERFRTMTAELVALKVDVLVTVGTQTAPYARDATTSIPVVFIFVPDPVGSNFVDSLRRPGRNMTGLSQFGADIVLKRLQFLKDIGSSPCRVGDFGMISHRREHAGEDLEA